MTAFETLAGQARPRHELLAELAAAPEPDQSRPWRVYRQYGHWPERPVCWHRWERVAERCARKREAKDTGELAARYTVRRTDGAR